MQMTQNPKNPRDISAARRDGRAVYVVRSSRTEPTARKRPPERAGVGAGITVRVGLDPRSAGREDCCGRIQLMNGDRGKWWVTHRWGYTAGAREHR
jgi:hypothetical protein